MKTIFALSLFGSASLSYAAAGWTETGYIRGIQATQAGTEIKLEASSNGNCTVISITPEQKALMFGSGLQFGVVKLNTPNAQHIVATALAGFAARKKVQLNCQADGTIFAVEVSN